MSVPVVRRRKKKAPAAPTRCLYVTPGEGQCPARPEQHGYCHAHVRFSPFERATSDTLASKILSARTAMDDLGAFILKNYVVFSTVPVPEDTARDYRNRFYRHQYLVGVRDSRRPGDSLPVEATAKAPE